MYFLQQFKQISQHNIRNIMDFQVIQKNKKIAKMKDENFKILDIHNYTELNQNNYKLKQLKSMCKYYKLKVTGKKSELHNRLYIFMMQTVNIVHIQKIFRGYLVRKLFSLYGPAIVNRKMCVNESDFFTLDNISEIPFSQFYSFKDIDGFIYGFDIRSIYNYNEINKGNIKNPYNRNPFPENLFTNLKKIWKLSNILNINVSIDIEQENENIQLTSQQILESRFLSTFQKIDELGFYTDHTWLMNLNLQKKTYFIRQLYDIWVYRAQLSDETKLNICPGNGNPFMGVGHDIFRPSITNVDNIILTIIHNFISNGIDQNDKWLGASFCLSALTLVSESAAISLPWLHQSVA